jgi:2-oxoglutarate ferredoxin oxidoreductase subunit alpha
MDKKTVLDDVAIVLCGEAGQGIQTVEQILVWVFKLSGYHVFASKEYMSRVRGGENSTLIRVSSHRVSSYVKRIDILVALSKGSIDHLSERISDQTLIIGDDNILGKDDDNIIALPFARLALEIGSPIFSNIIAAGVIARMFGVDVSTFNRSLHAMFARKGQEILNNDILAGKKGYQLFEEFLNEYNLPLSLKKDRTVHDEILLNGSEAVALGCLAGGLSFMSSYPMTPSTPVQAFIAKYADECGVIFEQAEDEIAALNMALGASYAGAKSMVATSGSGFALMEEAVGLSGMIETPVVIYIGMRPGPAVGLPTRTAQEDLDMAIYAGPGEFARAIFAPGTLEDAYILSHHAFELSEKYQIPVFILSDQYFADMYHNLPIESLPDLTSNDYVMPTTYDYQRYSLTDNGISPRGIPGYGNGLVVVDADDHDENGHLSEDLNLRKQMVEKRYNKLIELKEEVISPILIGGDDYEVLIIGWGSTFGSLKESLHELDDNRFSLLHFQQVYPLHPNVSKLLKDADRVIVFENNIKGQFANIISLETGVDVEKVNKYDGLPFSVEDILLKLVGV